WDVLGGIHCERSFREDQMEGDEAKIGLHFHNSGNPHVIEDLLIQDKFPPTRSQPEVFIYASEVSFKEPVEFSYRRVCQKRGVYELGPVVLKNGDPYGFFTHKRTLRLPGKMIVYPRIFDLLDFPTLPIGSTAQMGLVSGKRQGDSGDYFGIREYQQGDTLRTVHWRATARQNELIVKQFEKLASSEVTLLLDLHPNSDLGRGSESTLEVGIRLIGSIAKHLMLNDVLVQLIAYDEQPILLPLGKGQEHLANCLEILATAAANGKMPLAELIAEYGERVDPDTTLVVPLLDTDLAALEALAALKKKAVDIVALVMVSEAFKINDPNYRVDHLKFADFYGNLGAHVYPVKPYGYEELARQFNSLEGFAPHS
ncbi:MAG: DUF58 domain-containing protein, partial [Candidatus Omnitrophica bacterium]|nr:DUF58 domain-containing protein [Candidatus Omnitrophota bacterium]